MDKHVHVYTYIFQYVTMYIVRTLCIFQFYRKPLLALATTTQPILTEKEINTIFYRTEDLSDLHTQLHEKLEPQLRDWNVNTCVGDFFVELVGPWGQKGGPQNLSLCVHQ